MKKKIIKKKYNAPKLEICKIDSDISLVMMTVPSSDENPFENIEVEERHRGPSSSNFYISDDHEDVFGGSAPKY